MPTPTYKPLATVTVPIATASVTFSNIPATYRDLRLVANASTATTGNLSMRVNSDTGTNYKIIVMLGYSTGLVSSQSQNLTSIYSNYAVGLASTDRALNTYDIMDYSATDKHKTFLIRTNHAGEWNAIAARWANTAAITSVTVNASFDPLVLFTAGSTLSLYGIAS
jgi:hypothetical protein